MTTTDRTWAETLAAQRLRPLNVSGIARVTLVAAHPDDETLGAGGLAQRLHAGGTEVALVVATDGEAAFPASGDRERRMLAATRREELRKSLAGQGLATVEPVWLGLPDSGLHRCPGALADALGDLLASSELCLAPWPGDPHPDHRATGLAVLRAAPETAQCWSYPIWMWHRYDPGDPGIPWQRCFSHALSDRERAAKATAIDAFASQTGPGPGGEDPILPPGVLDHFRGWHEIFFREPPRRSASHARFTELYRGSPDPWQVRSRWYERRKRALALAALPRERYGTALEPACGNGTFTRELAARCDRLRASDPVHSAAEAARRATTDLPHVEIGTAALPGALVAEEADLVVHSEILYYLDDDDLAETLDRTAGALRRDGHVLAVHWKPWAPEAPRDGADAHHRLLAHPAFEPLVAHDDEEFLLHVLRRR
ncbi:bifunctional PIG-L family deacetylase/class I SAM-dependent methyltransferase [Amycolatopsis sp. CA-230715]|uniref:bifunctional PIG-L family deacetylase/class I SAM-dependent methyltransferase n=1 Tax=Amycolatopsis sp. CA-230715 TaxID=2745196 RepID=UPI001C32B8A8|nr:bifunctional PIG-L family deacetylase/class I SAM-dependent methyltransferase [Amycolatopsis sp. CA-230715]QWF86051.1 1D-myo-inositol 2-acetamido-2-deoxy-alpha-D-glucopyranoside deacetylase [Amycolatopsis sp. CA-230715]